MWFCIYPYSRPIPSFFFVLARLDTHWCFSHPLDTHLTAYQHCQWRYHRLVCTRLPSRFLAISQAYRLDTHRWNFWHLFSLFSCRFDILDTSSLFTILVQKNRHVAVFVLLLSALLYTIKLTPFCGVHGHLYPYMAISLKKLMCDFCWHYRRNDLRLN